MDETSGAESAPDTKPTAVVRRGRVTFKGVRAVLILIALVVAIGVLVYRSSPRVSVLISALLWFAMDVYWSIAETRRHQTKSQESSESRRRHGLLTMTALLLLFVPIPGLTGQFVPDTLTTALVGLGIQIGFNLFYFYARFYLGKLWSGAITIMSGHELIQTGPYRFLRHPMYTGMLGMAAGTAIVSGQYHALLGVALFVVAYARKIRMEDRVLAAEFGELFSIYRKRTAALIPWIL
jgi:protein-S-isoprenylcysteine O-methyltransferase Ste14